MDARAVSRSSKDREHMSDIGKKGGGKGKQGPEHMSEIGKKGGSWSARTASNMSDIGKKGGETLDIAPPFSLRSRFLYDYEGLRSGPFACLSPPASGIGRLP